VTSISIRCCKTTPPDSAIVLACQKERGPARTAEAEVGVRVIG
jgi:hypothetical protein